MALAAEVRMKPIAFIGAGFMGGALIRGILQAGLYAPNEVIASDVNSARLQSLAMELGVVAAPSNAAAVEGAGIVLLAVKPQVVATVLEDLCPTVSEQQLVISIAAGVPLAFLQSKLPRVPVIRAMPNLPTTVGAGATALAAGQHARETHLQAAEAIFGAVGCTVRVEEKGINAVTGLSGSGPAFVCLVIEALADGGVQAGLDRDVALRLAAQTVMGTGRLVLESGQHPAQVKDQVASPGGTTIAGLHALERGGLRGALMDAVAAAVARAEALAQATRLQG